MYKGYRIRVFPTVEQEEMIWKHIHACRFIWNYMINVQEERYSNNLLFLGRFDMFNLITPLKKQPEYSWLNEISRDSLNRTCTDVYNAYKRFFKGTANLPKYKTKKFKKQSYPICDLKARFYVTESYVKVQKIGKLKYKTNLVFPLGNDKKYLNPRLSYIHGKWFVSFNIEYDNQIFYGALTEKSMGIDLGIKDFAIIALGDNSTDEHMVFENINKSKRVRMLEHKLSHIEKVIQRKYRANKDYKKTKAIEKYEKMSADIQYHLSNIRNNYLHQVSHYLVSLKPQRVIMETLNVQEMMKDKHIASYVAKQHFHEFIRQMKYKCENMSIEFIQVEWNYPSSKKCSMCGNYKKNLSLSSRTYVCSYCGIKIDRDYNAARNLMKYVSHNERFTA